MGDDYICLGCDRRFRFAETLPIRLGDFFFHAADCWRVWFAPRVSAVSPRLVRGKSARSPKTR